MNLPSNPQLPIDLGGGLTLRTAACSDVDALQAFNTAIHEQEDVQAGSPPRVGVWTRDLILAAHPTVRPEDFLVVVEQASGKIVSSMNWISQTWQFEEIPVPVGRPELVGTDPAYRNRGLVRKQFEITHAWSAARGELLQGITGIPYYYRIFGYEMCVELDGGCEYPITRIPTLKDDETEPYKTRLASTADIPFLLECLQQTARRNILAARWDADLLRHEMEGKSADNVNRRDIYLIESLDGQPLGCFATSPFAWNDRMPVILFELKPGVSWLEITPVVLRAAAEIGKSAFTTAKSVNFVYLSLGTNHPAFEMLPHLPANRLRPYAWYLRVPDLPAFIHHVAPVLERRLAQSLLPGWSGELKMTFYRGGLRMQFDKGILSAVEPGSWEWTNANAAFPSLTFLQLLFGYRSLLELRDAYRDCWANRELEPVFAALFPKRPSFVWPIS